MEGTAMTTGMRYIKMVYEQGSFTKAAEKLFISQFVYYGDSANAPYGPAEASVPAVARERIRPPGFS